MVWTPDTHQVLWSHCVSAELVREHTEKRSALQREGTLDHRKGDE